MKDEHLYSNEEIKYWGSEDPDDQGLDLEKVDPIDLGEEPFFVLELGTRWDFFNLKVEIRTEKAFNRLMLFSFGKSLLLFLGKFLI